MQIEEYIKEIHGCIHIISEIIERQNGFKTIITKDNVIVPFENVVKHSKNIIDLIEIGDIVEYRINSLSELKVGIVKKYRDARSNKQYLGAEGFDITKIYIEKILTKEQYEANCYRLEE